MKAFFKIFFCVLVFNIESAIAHPLFEEIRSLYMESSYFKPYDFNQRLIKGRCFKENSSKTFGSALLIREINQDNGPIGLPTKFLAGKILVSKNDKEFDLIQIDEAENKYQVDYNEFEIYQRGNVYLEFDSIKNFVFGYDVDKKFIYGLLTDKSNETKIFLACYFFN